MPRRSHVRWGGTPAASRERSAATAATMVPTGPARLIVAHAAVARAPVAIGGHRRRYPPGRGFASAPVESGAGRRLVEAPSRSCALTLELSRAAKRLRLE